MRRQEFAINDAAEIQSFLAAQKWGLLTMNGDDGYPYAVPLNYLNRENQIYVHAGPQGRKLTLLAADSRVQFAVVKEYSLIPSYFSGSDMACSASQFFKSVLIQGDARRVTEMPEKIRVFQKMMAAFQPEGKYLPLAPEVEGYRKMLDKTELIMIRPEKISAKFKFGQNLPAETIGQIIRFLRERDTPLDRETIAQIERYRGERS